MSSHVLALLNEIWHKYFKRLKWNKYGICILGCGGALYTLYRMSHHFYYCYLNKYGRNINQIPLRIPPPSNTTPSTPLSRNHTGLFYDYIIVGAGSAGCVLANRLTQDPNISVLLIEAGGDDSTILANIPLSAVKLQRTEYDWQYQTVPQKYSHGGMNEQKSNWPRGKVMGGCSTINYMIWVRGHPDDFNGWAQLGCDGWSYNDILPHYKSLENSSSLHEPISELRGKHGEMHITQLSTPNPGVDAFIKACQQHGIPTNPDYNAESMFGASHIQTSIYRGSRWNGASAFIAPIISRPNLTILTYTHVTRLIIDEQKHVKSVAFVQGKNDKELRGCEEKIIGCNNEVIVCGGAVGSPHLLMLSGIGPRDQLTRQGIPCLVDLPVGQNLQDHVVVPVTYISRIPSINEPTIGLSDLWNYLWSRSGMLSSNFVEGTAFIKTGILSGTQPDLQYHYTPATLSPENWVKFNATPQLQDMFQKTLNGRCTQVFGPTLIRPSSVGTITLASPDPFTHPLIDPRYLSDPRDIAILVAGCKLSLELAAKEPFKHILGELALDLVDLGNPYDRATQADQYWEYFIRQSGATLYHPTSTCKMGAASDPTAVVTPDLRVKGITGLRVADASIMPFVISGNTNAPCMMIGSKCAELIRQGTCSSTSTSTPAPVVQKVPTRHTSKL